MQYCVLDAGAAIEELHSFRQMTDSRPKRTPSFSTPVDVCSHRRANSLRLTSLKTFLTDAFALVGQDSGSLLHPPYTIAEPSGQSLLAHAVSFQY